MDVTQLLITAFAVLGIVLMGAMAVVPTVLDLQAAARDRREPISEPGPFQPTSTRAGHQLAA